MGVYVSVKGWLECDRGQLAFVKDIIGAHDDGHYICGWGFPTKPFSGLWCECGPARRCARFHLWTGRRAWVHQVRARIPPGVIRPGGSFAQRLQGARLPSCPV
jgi:hypothetical protein